MSGHGVGTRAGTRAGIWARTWARTWARFGRGPTLWVLGAGVCLAGHLAGCNRSDDGAADHEEVAPSTAADEAEAPDNVEANVEPPEDEDPGDTARVWVGVWCEQGTLEPLELVFYMNGAEIQRLDTTCRPAEPGAAAPPNGGQFAFEIPAGGHVLRVEDVTHDAHAEQELHIGDHSWVVVNHRVLAGGTGFTTSFDASFERHGFDFVD